MKIISCENCAVVIDTDRIPDIDDKYNDEGSIIGGFFWDSDCRDFVEGVDCPCCGSKIYKTNGNLV